MQLTIVPSDNLVLIDKRAINLDLTVYPQVDGLHVVQWNIDKGHLEFNNYNASSTTFKPNEPIDSIAPYQDIVDAWYAAAAAEDAAKADFIAKTR